MIIVLLNNEKGAPTVFTPVIHGNSVIVDGGVANNIPIANAIRSNDVNLINSTIAFMTNHLATTLIKNTPPDLLIEISKKTCWTFDFYRAEELAEIGRNATRKKLNSDV